MRLRHIFKNPIRSFGLIAVSLLLLVIGVSLLFTDKNESLKSDEKQQEASQETKTALTPQASYASVYYVSPDGKDTNDGSKASLPFRTINKAISYAEAGTVIELADGEYYQTVSTLKHGDKNNPITIRGSRKVIVKGTSDAGRVIEIRHDYISLRGFTVDGASGDAKDEDDFRDKLIYAIGETEKDGVDSLKVDDMLVQNAGGECIRLRYFAVGNEISNSTIKNCGIYDFKFKAGGKNGEGIYIGTAPEQTGDGKNPTSEVDGSHSNYIHNNVIETYGNECVDIKEGSYNNLVEYNLCQYQLDPDSAGLDSRGNSNIFRFNTTKNNIGAGIRLGGDEPSDGINNEVYSNTITDNKGGAIKLIRMPQGKICENTVKNNNDDRHKKSKSINPSKSCNN